MNYEQFKSFNNIDFLTSDNEFFYVKTKIDNMSIFLYQNKSPENQVTKSLINGIELKGTLRENCNIINPILTIQNDDMSILNYNYIYIPLFKRYYYINNISTIVNKLYQIECKIDVLMSFKNDIKNLECVVVRQANKQLAIQTFTPDDKIPYTSELEQTFYDLDYGQYDDSTATPFFDNKTENPYTILKVMGG